MVTWWFRIATVLFYLSELVGGGTAFLKIGLAVKPKWAWWQYLFWWQWWFCWQWWYQWQWLSKEMLISMAMLIMMAIVIVMRWHCLSQDWHCSQTKVSLFGWQWLFCWQWWFSWQWYINGNRCQWLSMAMIICLSQDWPCSQTKVSMMAKLFLMAMKISMEMII